MNTMHLFAGIGGGLLADRILGHDPIVAVEWDAYVCQVLRERAADGWFPNLRVWEGDVRLFDPSEYAGQVDCIHAGFPCQDISVAGNQAGIGEETRSGLYREVIRIARILLPRYLYLENVAAIISNGLGSVLSDLAALGYDCEWICLRASDCGAAHHRDRWWLLADRGLQGICQRWVASDVGETRNGQTGIRCDGIPCISIKEGQVLADSEELQRNGSDDNSRIVMEGFSFSESGNGCGAQDVAYTDSTRREGYGNSAKRRKKEYSESSFSGWWEVESNVGRVANGVTNRIHRLKGIGNAQVPLQAAVAWCLLGGPINA